MVHLLVFHEYINEMQGSRSKIPSENIVRQRCAEGFNSGFKWLMILCEHYYEVLKNTTTVHTHTHTHKQHTLSEHTP
jgi:hypothetical protein